MEKVYLLRCASYDATKIEEGLRRAIEILGVAWPQSTAAFIKPNCVFAHPKYAPASYTHPAVIQAVTRLLKKNSSVVGENGMVGFPTRFSFEQAGYARLAREEQFTLLPLDEARIVSMPLSKGKLLHQVMLPQALQNSKFFVSLPKLKASAYLPFSGALENHLGLLQHDVLHKSHEQIAVMMADVLEVVHPHLIVVDGVEIGEGQSSVVTTPKPLGALIIGMNAVAVDVVCAAIFGLEPREVAPIRVAAERGYGPSSLSEIELMGDMSLDELQKCAASRTQVDPRPENYPLPKQVKIVVGKPYSLTGTAGALSETFAFLERGGIALKGARETVIVIGKSEETQTASDDTAAIIFLGDKSYAPYKGYTRIVRLRGEPVLTAQMLENVPFAMKLRNPVDDFRGALWNAQLQSKINAWRSRRGS
jgi:uncharacterized protein (DUF362 family)